MIFQSLSKSYLGHFKTSEILSQDLFEILFLGAFHFLLSLYKCTYYSIRTRLKYYEFFSLVSPLTCQFKCPLTNSMISFCLFILKATPLWIEVSNSMNYGANYYSRFVLYGFNPRSFYHLLQSYIN